MSLRNMNVAPRAFLGFAVIALLVVVLGVFAQTRMTLIRQASIDMGSNQLPSVGYLGNLIEGVPRMRILSFRVLINREPEALREAQERIGVLTDKVRKDQKSYASLPAEGEELARYNEFAATLETYLVNQAQMLELSRQNKTEELRNLINTRIKAGTDLMGAQLNTLVEINKANADEADRLAGEQYDMASIGILLVAVVAALMTVLLAWLLTRSIVSPLNQAVRAA